MFLPLSVLDLKPKQIRHHYKKPSMWVQKSAEGKEDLRDSIAVRFKLEMTESTVGVVGWYGVQFNGSRVLFNRFSESFFYNRVVVRQDSPNDYHEHIPENKLFASALIASALIFLSSAMTDVEDAKGEWKRERETEERKKKILLRWQKMLTNEKPGFH